MVPMPRRSATVPSGVLVCAGRILAQYASDLNACGGSFGQPRTSHRRAIVMMQAAEHGDRDNSGRTRERNAVTGNRDPLAEPLVRPCLVEVAEGILSQYVQQVAFGKMITWSMHSRLT